MIEGKINVLHLLLSLETGGMERFVYEHCLEIDNNRFNLSVCCIDRLGGFYESLVEKGIRVDLLQKNQDHFDWLFSFKLSQYLKSNNIHIVHTHPGAFFHGSVAGFLAKTPCIVYTEHGRHLVEPKVIFVLDHISSIFADKIVTVSPDLEQYLIEKIKLPAKKIITIINGVNTDRFMPREKSKDLLRKLGLKSEYKIIGTVGRLAHIKDQETLLKAYEIVVQNFPATKLVLVGDGPCEKDLRDLAREFGISDSVIFAGNRNDIPDILNIFDVFVLSSLREGTSISLLEAMASGVPPVVTNVGGNPNIVTDNFNGYVVEPKDYKNMAFKIIDLLNNPHNQSLFSNRSRQLVETEFSFHNNVAKYERLYFDLLNICYDT